jgi:hypothetical protein
MATTEIDAEKAQAAAELAAATAQRDALKPKVDQGVEQWTQQGQHAQDVAQGAVTQAYDAQGELLKQAPGEANLPEAKPPTINPDDYQGLTYALIGMAMISGAAKGDWMSASSSLNGAMKGIVEGNAQKAEEYWKKYQADYKRASDKHNDAMREYDNKVRQSDLTINQRLRAAQEVARKYEHMPINVAADQKSLTEVEKHIDSLRSAETRLAESHDRVATQAETARQARLERQQAHADLRSIIAPPAPAMTHNLAGLPSGTGSHIRFEEQASEPHRSHPLCAPDPDGLRLTACADVDTSTGEVQPHGSLRKVFAVSSLGRRPAARRACTSQGRLRPGVGPSPPRCVRRT